MTGLDGLYRYASTTTLWNDEGVVVRKGATTRHVPWSELRTARLLRPVAGGTFVQLVCSQHVEVASPLEDPLSVPVRSDADANHLLMTFQWRAKGAGVAREDVL